MPKLNKFEAHIIENALKESFKQDIKQIRDIESQGKHSLFSEDYIEDVYEEIFKKLKKYTYKNK